MVSASQVESWIGHKVVDFHYGHIHLMQLGDFARELSLNIPDYANYMRINTEGTPAFTVIYQGKPILCFGISPIWPGLGEGWMIPAKQLQGNSVRLVRGARQLFDEIGHAMQLRRLQFMVRSSHLHAVKFAEILYFNREATLHRYGAEGDDYHVYVRFY